MSAIHVDNASSQFSLSGEYSPAGQGRGVLIDSLLHTEAGGAMLGLGVYPTITVEDAETTTSVNGLEVNATFTGAPTQLNYAVQVSCVDFVAPTNTIEASTVRIDNEPTGATRNYALHVAGGKNRFGGMRQHSFGNGTEDTATQLLLRTTADTVSRRGLWIDSSLAGIGPGDFGAVVLVNGTLKEPTTGTASGAGIRIDAPTITSASGDFNTLSSLYVSGAPSAASNNYALFVDAGNSRFDGDVLANTFTPVSQQTYTVTNVTTDRSYDASTATVSELAATLGTLIADLRSIGLLL